jgi:hypothetical protein
MQSLRDIYFLCGIIDCGCGIIFQRIRG